MPADFYLAIKLTEGPAFDALLGDIASGVLEQLGFSAPDAAEIVAALRNVVEGRAAAASCDCDVSFQCEAGRLVIVVSRANAEVQRLTRPLPGPD